MEKLSKMSAVVNWANEIAAIAGPYDGNRKSWLARAARKAGVTCRQAKALYYGESINPRHDVATSVLSAADRARVEEAKRDALVVVEFFNQRAEALSDIDANLHRAEIDAFVEAARILCGRDSA